MYMAQTLTKLILCILKCTGKVASRQAFTNVIKINAISFSSTELSDWFNDLR